MASEPGERMGSSFWVHPCLHMVLELGKLATCFGCVRLLVRHLFVLCMVWRTLDKGLIWAEYVRPSVWSSICFMCHLSSGVCQRYLLMQAISSNLLKIWAAISAAAVCWQNVRDCAVEIAHLTFGQRPCLFLFIPPCRTWWKLAFRHLWSSGVSKTAKWHWVALTCAGLLDAAVIVATSYLLTFAGMSGNLLICMPGMLVGICCWFSDQFVMV